MASGTRCTLIQVFVHGNGDQVCTNTGVCAWQRGPGVH